VEILKATASEDRPLARNSREVNAVTFATDLGIVDDCGRRVRDESEAVSSAHRRQGRNGNGNVADLEEVPGKMIRCVMDAQEVPDDAAPLDVDRFDPRAHES